MTTENLRQEARKKYLSGDIQTAILLLTQAITAEPSNMEIALDMVQIFLDINELEQAENLFNRLPDTAKKGEMGVSIASQLNFKKLAFKTEGIEALKINIAKKPDDYQSHFDLALCLFATHNIDKGMDALFFIQENNPAFRDNAAGEMIAMICNMLNSSNPQESGNYRRRLASLMN